MIDRDLLLITPDFPPNRGGVARYLDALAVHFSDRITVIAQTTTDLTGNVAPHPDPLLRKERGNEESAGTNSMYPVIRQSLLFRLIWPHWLKTTFDLIRRRSMYRYVITSHVLPFGVAAMVAKRFTGKPYVVIVHGMDLRLALASTRKKMLCRRALQNAYLVVANSNALAQELLQTFGLKNLLVVYPSVDASNAGEATMNRLSNDHPLAPSSKEEGGLRQEDGSRGYRLLTVSRLVERKGHDRVLTALAMLKLNGSLSNFHYDIVGTGPMQSTLEQLVEELGLQGHVRFLGDLDDAALRETYSNADVFVMPVKNDTIDKEGFGLVFLEAALFEVPSISTNMSGVNEAVIDGETGLLVADNDREELAQAILSLAKDPVQRHALGVAARERTLREFRNEIQFGKLDPYLE